MCILHKPFYRKEHSVIFASRIRKILLTRKEFKGKIQMKQNAGFIPFTFFGGFYNMSDELNMDMDIVTVVDDDGKEHVFEELDRIETDDGSRYVALLPVIDDEEEILDGDGDVLILKVLEEDGENYLVQIEDDDEFKTVGNIFEDRLIEKYEAEESDE